MDQYTSDLLTKWSLIEYVDAFAAARIDVHILQMLEDDDIASLISPIGDRLRLKANLAIWKQEMSQCSGNAVKESQNPNNSMNSSFVNRILHDLDSSSVTGIQETESVPETQDLSSNSVLAILRKTPEGNAILAKGDRTRGLLNPELRKELSNLIIRDYLEVDPSKVLKGPEFLNYAHEIRALFPQESPAIFYAPYLAQTDFQPKRNASGILYNTYGTKKKHLRQLGALPLAKRSRSRSSSSHRELNIPELPVCGIRLSHLDEGEADLVEEKLKLLESPDPGPWQTVEEDWATTIAARLRFLYYQKGTLSDYLDRFPILKSSCGFKLLLQDYAKLHPGKGDGMIVVQNSSKKIVDIAITKAALTKDAYVKRTIDEYVVSVDSEIEESVLNASLLLLAFIINIAPVRRKNGWKASRTEFRDGFITHVATQSDVLPMLTERRNKLAKIGATFQPLVVYCGETLRTITKVFVVCENTLYEFPSLSCGVDAAFKIFHSTATQYPNESYDIWLLIQQAFYEVYTDYDRPTASVKQIMVDLGLKLMIK